MRRIQIISESICLNAELNDTPTADQIYNQLPIEGRVNTWGEEIYFSIPIVAEQDADARERVSVGELGYWPVGRAFCIFFGPTPASIDEQPRAYSPVNIVGKLLDDAQILKKVGENAEIKLIKIDTQRPD